MNNLVNFMMVWVSVLGLSACVGNSEIVIQANSKRKPIEVWTPDTTIATSPCSGASGVSEVELFDFLGLEKPSENPWDEYSRIKLDGEIREIVDACVKIEILVEFNHNNELHWKKKRAKETKRADLILFGQQPEYFRYLLPPLELNSAQFQKAKDLLLAPDACLEFGSGPTFSGGIIHGPRYVLRVKSQESEILVTVSKVNHPSIWISGESIAPLGGLLHPDTELQWKELIEEAIDGSGYN